MLAAVGVVLTKMVLVVPVLVALAAVELVQQAAPREPEQSIQAAAVAVELIVPAVLQVQLAVQEL
jgi:hypothetical protein